MTQFTHSKTASIGLHVQRRMSWLVTFLAASAAAAALLVFVISNDDSSPSVSSQSPAQIQNQSPSVRYDGGPNEGNARLAVGARGSGSRYDGGPEEGSAASSISRSPGSSSSSQLNTRNPGARP